MHSAAYCHPKSVFEHRLCELASRLHDLTSRLIGQAGQDHQRFIATKAECDTVHAEIALSRKKLQAHRAEQGC